MNNILRVAQLGYPTLRQVALPVNEDAWSDWLLPLADDMVTTMQEYRGVGLAAPQVRRADRLFVAQLGLDEPTVVVNPTVTPLTDETMEVWEGCLSIDGYRGLVARPRAVQLTGLDRNGNELNMLLEDFPAIVAQHENDHLDGIVYLDRMNNMQQFISVEEYERQERERLAAIADQSS